MSAVYWPPGVPREYTVEAYRAAIETCGFAVCKTSEPEPGFEKVALYAIGAEPQHAARQLPSGSWTSKLGMADDIEHGTLEALEGEEYGNVALLMRRRSRAR